MSISLQSFSDGTAPPPVNPPTSGTSFLQSTASPAVALPDPGLSFVDSTLPPVSPPSPGPSLFDTNAAPGAPWMPDLTIAGGPSGVADFINNGGSHGFPNSPLPEINGFSANWLTEAINSGSPLGSLIGQDSDSTGWGYGRNPHGTVTAQILQNFLHFGSNG